MEYGTTMLNVKQKCSVGIFHRGCFYASFNARFIISCNESQDDSNKNDTVKNYL